MSSTKSTHRASKHEGPQGQHSQSCNPTNADGQDDDHIVHNLDPDMSPSDVSLLRSRSRRRSKIPLCVADESTVIPTQKLPKDFESTPVNFVVGHAYTPDDFHVQLLSKVHLLDQLMDDMNAFYCDHTVTDYSLSYDYPRIQGLLVAAIYVEEDTWKSAWWHRAIILHVEDLDRVHVKYLDYGTLGVVHLSYVRLLRREFCKLSIQAIPARLKGIKPFGKTKHWSLKAIAVFREACWRANNFNRGGVVAVEIRRGKLNRLDLVLIDTSSNTLTEGVNLSEELLRLHLASHKPISIFGESSEESWTSISQEPSLKVDNVYCPKVNVNDQDQQLCEYDQKTMDMVLAMSVERVRPWLENESNLFDVYDDICMDMINLCLSDVSNLSNPSRSN
ncbi:hypothetical protein TCAL_09930 [Tigriopus californicus]|uniref:Tudor domain-containing protein n=1 Tax=Tigriopus californicus TaxID=6832 RepID=A0A553NQS3_TIGCA|nr:hypothetical protein TCAL_09930 [Tigriopus californicus]